MHGGKRKGAGRKAGSNQYGEPTKPVRVPISYVETLKKHLANASTRSEDALLYPSVNPLHVDLPFYSNTVSAGFPSPADDHVERRLDLNEHLIHNFETTFFLRVKGDSMIDAHIMEDDLLVVDRSLNPKHKDIVIAVLHGEITVKRLIRTEGKLALKPENSAYPLISIKDPDDLMIWGVVTNVIHKVLRSAPSRVHRHDCSA